MEFNKQTSTVRSSASEAIIDQGLRAYMLKVYNYMASALVLTGFVALLTAKFAVISFEPLILSYLVTLYNSGLAWIVMLAPLGVEVLHEFWYCENERFKSSNSFLDFCIINGLIFIVNIFSLHSYINHEYFLLQLVLLEQ